MDGILYLNVGMKHLRNLAVSLFTLRKHTDAPVTILSGDDAAKRTLNLDDPRLGDVTLQPFDYNRKAKRNSIYFAKTSMHKLSPYERTIYLDADTCIHGDLTELYPDTEEVVNWTRFADWDTQLTRIKNRINGEGWRDILPEQVAYQSATAYPAINTGILGFSRTSERVMNRWHKETAANISFICDEVCAQLIAYEYPHNIMDHRFNASPRYSWKALGLKDLSTSDVRVIHSHGNKGLKCDEAQQSLFLDSYFGAFHSNFCGLQTWDETAYPKKHPSRYVEAFHRKYRGWCRRNGVGWGKYPKRFDLIVKSK